MPGRVLEYLFNVSKSFQVPREAFLYKFIKQHCQSVNVYIELIKHAVKTLCFLQISSNLQQNTWSTEF
jgi:Zn-dependent peptidase ImmA (M78 family)